MNNEEYKGWLVSTSLVKRSLAVMGHHIVGHLIIGIPLVILLTLGMFALGGISTSP